MIDSFHINGRPIGDAHPPYVIAECCNNFNGDIVKAREMVVQAAYCGADAVKFQMRLRPDRITPEQHAELKELAARYNIAYLCTAFDETGIGILTQMGVAAIKIGSAEITNSTIVRAAALAGRPLILSTGGCEVGDIGTAWHIVARTETPFALMQCTSVYPCPPSLVNLGFLQWMREHYYVPIGLSDHTAGIACSLAAVALGARLIEKHFTLDRTQPGPDQCCSVEPRDLIALVKGCRDVFDARGVKKAYLAEEREKLGPMRDA